AFSLDMRWLPYATFEWTRVLIGPDIVWLRLGNLSLHIANCMVLFLFLQRLFEAVLPVEKNGVAAASENVLAPVWLAFFGALIFALHPASVYGAAYLIQRTTLMATLFTLVMWHWFLKGITRGSRWWLLASAGAYLLAVLA